jgi:hypothetical protein
MGGVDEAMAALVEGITLDACLQAFETSLLDDAQRRCTM